MTILRVTTDAQAGYLDKIVTLAGTAAKLTFYDGTIPSTGGGSIGGSAQLAQCTCANPLGTVAWDGGSSTYQLTFGAIAPDSDTDADGTATWARLASATGTWLMDMNVSATGGGGSIIVSSTGIYQHGTMTVNSAVISLTVS